MTSGMSRLLLSICLVLALTVAGCGGDDKSGGGGGGGGKGNLKGTGYTAQIPDGWEDAKDRAETGAINFDAVIADEPQDDFATNINVIRETPPGDPSLDQVTEAFEGQAGSLADDDGLSDTEDRELGGHPARTYTYIIEREDPPKVRQRQVFTVRDGAVYTITFSALDKSFAAEEKAFDGFLESWEWE